MPGFEFTLRFALPPDASSMDALVERLGEHGCDDALVGIGPPGRVVLAFNRDGSSAEVAILDALADVRKAIPDASLIEAGPDFVGLTEVADRVGVSRQNMRKLMLSHRASFPPPIHEGNAAVWHLAPVLQWLKTEAGYHIDDASVEVARTAMSINITKEAVLIGAALQDHIRALVA